VHNKALSIVAVFLFLFILSSHSGSALLAFMDKNVYLVNETALITVNRTQNLNITGLITDINGTSAANFTIGNGTAGLVEYSYAQTLPAGQYTLNLTQTTDNVKIRFSVAGEIMTTIVRLMGSATPVFVNTSTAITGSGSLGGNFSDILALNKSQGVYHGNRTNLTGDGKNYRFVVVDENVQGVYDTVYVDDDISFRLYNDTEDNGTYPFIETSKKQGEMLKIDAGNKFIVGEIERTTGKGVYLIRPLDSPAFSSSDTAYVLVLVADRNGMMQTGYDINISVANEAKQIVASQLVSIGSAGYANISFSLSGYGAGRYAILGNGTPADMLVVESFRLNGKVTDLSDSPSMSFAPGSKAKIWAVSRNTSGDLIPLTIVPQGNLTLPGGSVVALTFAAQADSTGVYTAETGALTATGEYKVVVAGTKGSDLQKFEIGIRVQSLQMMTMTINPRYLDEGAGQGTMVDAFAPNSNITTAVFMLNVSKGSSLMTGGPPCGFDGTSCVGITCNAGQFAITVRDEFGNKYKLDTTNFTAMTIGQAAVMFAMQPPSDPGVSGQCMLIMWAANNTWLSKTGHYKLEIKFTNSTYGELSGGQTFSVQRLLASGSTVDFKGDAFSFFGPNSTVRIKIEIRDLATDQLLSADKILNARFTEMWKEWPERRNVFNGEVTGFNKSMLNESIENSTIVFTSPPEEGFYSAKFRFVANLNGTPVEGTGLIFFELKKYMIWGNLQSMDQGSWFVKVGNNITLTVQIMDIDMGSQYGQEGSTASCTGCTGLIANVSSLRNEQFFREMVQDVDYTVTTGVVTNSTSGATIIIQPIGTRLKPGWYGMDIKLQRPGSTESYYGWGGFEIRNFWVDVFEVAIGGDGNYTKVGGGEGSGGIAVPVGGTIQLGVAAYEPPTPMTPPSPLQVLDVDPEGLQNNMVWPPLPVAESEYSLVQIGEQNMTQCWGDYCEKFTFYLVNFTTAETIKESSYMLSFRVTTALGSDIGSTGVMVASYALTAQTVPESKMYEMPPIYSNQENLTLVISATDFQGNPHNLTNVTVRNVYSEKAGRPIKFRFVENYTNNCTGWTPECTLNIYLPNLQIGGYYAELEISDPANSKQTGGFKFEIRNMIFSVPQIYEGWTRDYSTPDKTIEAQNGEDPCDNEIRMNPDNCDYIPGNLVCVNPGSNITNITIPYNKTAATYHWARMCINQQEGRWQYASAPGDQCQGNNFAYIAGNGTNVWINTISNLSGAPTLTNTSTFTLPGIPGTWYVQTLRENEPSYVRINQYGMICGRNETGQGQGNFIRLVPPAAHANYSTFYHGSTYIVGNMWEPVEQRCQDEDRQRNDLICLLNITDRPIYVYHNTTHLWLYSPVAGTINFTSAQAKGPYAVGDIAQDGYGGLWKVISISKGVVKLRGQNILENGIMINTSLTTSGNVYVGELREESLGMKNQMSGQQNGMDLDGDGLKNSTLYFLILDNGSGYNLLAFSDYLQKWNFTNTSRVKNVNSVNRTARQVGVAEKLTLLSIDPRAQKVKLYDPFAKGDWPELGDSRIGDNVTIPVIVKSPSGAAVAANVSVPHMKIKTPTTTRIVATGLPPLEITGGIGEIRVNITALGYIASGGYEFEVKANNANGEETLNEWNWPRTTARNFLVDGTSGYGGIISSFVQVPVLSYGGQGSSVRPRDLFTINQTGYPVNPVIKGVMEAIQHEIPQGQCPSSILVYPANGGTNTQNRTFQLDRLGQYYAYWTPANETKIWIRSGSCNFTDVGTGNYSQGNPINITIGSELFQLYVLNTNASAQTASIGLLNFSAQTIEPIRMDRWNQNPAPRWNIMSVNISGTIYNFVFANDTALQYPQAGTWGAQDVSKAVWVGSDGTFAGAQKKRIGDNITVGYYLARVGPGPWDGIVLANGSNLAGIGITGRPAFDLKVQDGTPVYFGVVNESDANLGLDLNKNSVIGDVFYMVAFDDFPDGLQNLTRIYVDDDLNISEPWWANSSNQQQGQAYTYYDFYGNEQGNISEQEGNTPRGMWGGNVRFAPWNQSIPWEQSAEWNIRAYNGTKMVLEKNLRNMNQNMTISLTVKAFDFSQNPIAGATVGLVKLMRFGGGQPFSELNASNGNFTLVQTQNVTDTKGYGMLRLIPPGSGWLNNAQYIATMSITYNGMTEVVDNYFMVGQQQGGGGP
jgi:hypothetical protein